MDQEIVDAFGLVSLLLAFIAAYFAALWPVVHDLLAAQTPEILAQQRGMARRCKSYSASMAVLAVILVSVLALLGPLSVRVLSDVDFSRPFSTVRAGLILVQALQLAGLITAGILACRLRARASTMAH